MLVLKVHGLKTNRMTEQWLCFGDDTAELK